MDNIVLVEVSERLKHFGDEPDFNCLSLPFSGLRNRASTFQKVHGEKWIMLRVKTVIQDVNDVRMLQRSKNLKFVCQRDSDCCCARINGCCVVVQGRNHRFERNSLASQA